MEQTEIFHTSTLIILLTDVCKIGQGKRRRSQVLKRIEAGVPRGGRGGTARTVVQDRSISSTMTTIEEESVRRLHLRVVQSVKEALKKYRPGAPGFIRGLQKIRTEADYCSIAETLSNQLRDKIIESYQAYNNQESLEGIKFTGDHKMFIETEVDSYFESLPITH